MTIVYITEFSKETTTAYITDVFQQNNRNNKHNRTKAYITESSAKTQQLHTPQTAFSKAMVISYITNKIQQSNDNSIHHRTKTYIIDVFQQSNSNSIHNRTKAYITENSAKTQQQHTLQTELSKAITISYITDIIQQRNNNILHHRQYIAKQRHQHTSPTVF